MKILLIPSAVLVSRDMRRKFGEIPTALFPLGDKTMIDQIYDKYKDCVDKVYIVVHKKKLLIKDYIAYKKLPINIIELDELKDLGYTILYGMDKILQENSSVDYVYVNFADSLLNEELTVGDNNCIYYAKNPNFEEWTYFEEIDGRLVDILDKDDIGEHEDRLDNFNKIFVGVFGFDKPEEFLINLDEALTKNIKMDTLYQALYEYSAKRPFDFIETDTWFDVGHSENYLKAKTSVEARVFNTIEIDEKRGILTKSSDNKEKLVNEIRWYLRLPNKLQYLLPRIYDYSLDMSAPYVTMEYYGYHTMHDSLMYGNLPLIKWQDIFKKLLFAIDDMEKYKVSGEREEFENSLRDIYLNKTFSRLDQMRNKKGFKEFFLHPMKINGKMYNSLNEYIAILPELINRLVIHSFEGCFNIIHGDLCFANILLEDTYNFIRVIDPRGKFGGYDIYGDGRYELAKLFHTLEGHYDFIIEDMFNIEINGTEINYQIHKDTKNIFKVFCDTFRNKLNDIQAIRLIEATLFLSMIPLHSDYEKRQYAMLATGVMLLERVIQETKEV